MWSRASSRRPVDASIHAASSRRVGPVPGGRGVAGRIECGQDPLCASAVAEHDPGPAEPVDEAEREQRVVARCSRPTRRRCWRARPGRRRDARLGDCCAHLAWRIRPRRRTMRRARRGPARTVRRRSSLRARTPGCCRAAGSERSSALSSSSTITSERLASRPTTSIAAAAGTSSASRTDSTAGRGAPPAKVASAHRPRWSSGNNRS